MKISVRRTDANKKPSIALPALLISAMLALSACANTASTSAAASSNDTAPSQGQFADIIASPQRSAADRNNDIHRKPAQTLAFIGIKPGMVALDLSASGGYMTELISLAVGPHGRVYAQNPPPRDASSPPQQAAAPEGASAPAPAPSGAAQPPAGKPMTSAQILAARAANPLLPNIIPIVRRFEDPVPPEMTPNRLDLVTFMFNYHDLGHWGVDRAQLNKAVFTALKPGGMYIIADHAGRPGTGISESGTLHRIEESFLIQEVQAAGFKLVDEGFFMHNPSDPRDKNTPEPPQPKDEFILKFIKP
jgi:predicted methyltransferase